MAYRERFVTAYLNPLEVAAEFANLSHQFPNLCRLEELPYLTHGYQGVKVEARGRQKMYVLRITAPSGPASKPAILLMRSPHAREWINALAVVETARQLLENYRPADMDPRVQAIVTTMNHAEVMIVPEGNPDGARFSFFDPGQRMWRKNLRPAPSGSTCAGVDCNRNYPRYFGEAGSSGDPCTEIYRGPQALSEPETANISHLVSQYRQIIFAVDSHSSGQDIFRPSPNGGTYIPSEPVSPADDAIYLKLEAQMNEAIRIVQGIRYSTGSTSNHAGASDEYFFFDQQIFGFDLECGQDFQPPVADAITAALEVAAATRAIAWCAAGQTDVDVAGLVARRQRADVADWRGQVRPIAVDREWAPKPLPPEKWRRFVARLTVEGGKAEISRVALELKEKGFDLMHRPASPTLTVVASAQELADLLRRGHRVSVAKDVYAGE